MREIAVKKTLAAGGRSFGAMIFEFFTPGLPRIVKNAGALGVVPLARVPATEYDFIARALDCGALGVMVPLVDSAEQAEFIVSCTRYLGHGFRPIATGTDQGMLQHAIRRSLDAWRASSGSR